MLGFMEFSSSLPSNLCWLVAQIGGLDCNNGVFLYAARGGNLYETISIDMADFRNYKNRFTRFRGKHSLRWG